MPMPDTKDCMRVDRLCIHQGQNEHCRSGPEVRMGIQARDRLILGLSSAQLKPTDRPY